jgi:hypothetical protein
MGRGGRWRPKSNYLAQKGLAFCSDRSVAVVTWGALGALRDLALPGVLPGRQSLQNAKTADWMVADAVERNPSLVLSRREYRVKKNNRRKIAAVPL